MSSNIVQFSLFLISGVILTVILRDVKNEYVLPITVAAVIMVMLQILPMISDIMRFSDELSNRFVSDNGLSVLYKAVGTSVLVQYVADFSRENGIESIASKAELFGRLYISILCLPLIEKILSAVSFA